MIYFALIVLAIIVVAYLFNRKAENSQPGNTAIDKVLQHIVKVKPSEIDATPDTPVDFGYKISWLAVRSDSSAQVAEAIGAVQTTPCNWESGIKLGYKKTSFITPPINGWVLVVGYHPIPEDEKLIPEVEEKLLKLSRTFGEVQLFGTHRVVEFHCWSKAVNGKIVRGYAYASEVGETIWVYGEPTPAEPKNLFNSLSTEYKANPEAYAGRADIDYANEETVTNIARAWSVDPTTLSERENVAGLGLVVL